MAVLVKDKAATDAADVLAAHGRRAFPIDVEAIARSLGLRVTRTQLRQGISGMLQVDPDATPQIYVDVEDVRPRQRFTIAHELGHYYERTTRGEADFNFIDRRGGRYDIHEFYADEFAGNLLMPIDEVTRQVEQGASLAAMVAHFGVSLPALHTRLRRLGLEQ